MHHRHSRVMLLMVTLVRWNWISTFKTFTETFEEWIRLFWSFRVPFALIALGRANNFSTLNASNAQGSNRRQLWNQKNEKNYFEISKILNLHSIYMYRYYCRQRNYETVFTKVGTTGTRTGNNNVNRKWRHNSWEELTNWVKLIPWQLFFYVNKLANNSK